MAPVLPGPTPLHRLEERVRTLEHNDHVIRDELRDIRSLLVDVTQRLGLLVEEQRALVRRNVHQTRGGIAALAALAAELLAHLLR
jgi:hypothetical protein